MGRILVIDDEIDLVLLLKEELEERGHEVLTAFDGVEGIEQAGRQPDLILLDVMMPRMDGYEVCKKIRDAVSCPIIFLSAKQSEMDRVKGFMLGGDDYVSKPFGLRELMARIEANLRREERAKQADSAKNRAVIRFGDLTLDLHERGVRIKGQWIPLTKREYEIVELLALHPGQVFAREQIYEKIWGYDAEGDSSTIVEHVKKIRAKFAAAEPSAEYIVTVWGVGYKWNRGS